ncbi:MAG TPA: TonB-dependent receptor [Steroidobacteraceae bacterium]|nr:TonB-dependent receptor [Steroidobacteraceae bacterium]
MNSFAAIHSKSWATVLMILLATGTDAVMAQHADSTTDALKNLSLDQLMDVEVTSVSRHPEKLLQTASAIQVITRDDIRRSGATSIPEALRLADNLEVAQKNSHDWAISARGFNTALANKLLVMIDGRTVYTPLFSGVFWDVQDYLLEDIDRIEVISGPGGTLWGANAVNGVINIITRKAADTQGAYAEGGGGNQLQEFGGARYGGTVGDATQFRVYGKYFDRGDESIADGSAAADSWHQAQGGFRMDSALSSQDDLSVHGDFYQGRENETGIDTARTGGGNLVGQWTHESDSGSQMSLQSYYDRTHLADPIAAATLGTIPIAPAGFLIDDLTTFDVDFQYQLQLGALNHVVWGLGYRLTHDAVQNAPGLGFFPTTLNQDLYSAFAQDEIALRSDLALTLGSKIEHNDYTGFEFEPNVRLMWSGLQNQTIWSAISRAVRTPSRVDEDLKEAAPPLLVILEGASDFKSEEVIAYELGYRALLDERTSVTLSTYFNDYNDVRSTSYTPATLIPFFFQNNLEGHTYGAELSVVYQALDDWKLHLGYDLLQEHLHVKPGEFDLDDALNETADPQQQFAIRSSATLPANIDFDTTLRWVDTLHINNGSTLGSVPSYFGLDGRLAWHSARGIELSLVAQNMLSPRHVEYGYPSPLREQIDRSYFAKVAWRF